MNKRAKIIITGLLVLIALFFLWQYLNKNNSNNQFNNNQLIVDNSNFDVSILDNYLGSYYKGNYVWGGAMNLAWNELGENIIKEKIILNTDDSTALEMVSKLDNSPFSKNDLDEESYYIKSGYGQSTVDEINRESRKKFPSKSFSDLQIDLGEREIISYAYFLKEIEYKEKFKKDNVWFNNEKVAGFVSNNEENRNNVKIVKYENDDKFIIKLELKDNKDELILAKGYDMESPKEVISEIIDNNKKNLPTMGENDNFSAPILHLDHVRTYNELIGKFFANNDFQTYFISQMYEKIKFDMDEEGARVENEAVIVAKESMPIKPVERKRLLLNEPYWLVMKRADSNNPYFILGINNIELMEEENTSTN